MIAKLKVLWVEKLKIREIQTGKKKKKKYTRFDFIQTNEHNTNMQL